jgi:hypothetical protein
MLDIREIRAALAGAAVVGAYLCLVLLSGRVDLVQFTKLFLAYASGSIALWVAVGTIAMFVQVLRRACRSGSEPFLFEFARESIEARWKRDRGASLLWPPLLFASLMASFNSFKQMVLPLAGFSFDPWLASVDRIFFFGHDGWRVTHALLGSPEATRVIDSFYHGWFLPMSLGVILCAWLPAATYRLRTQYLLSYISVWIGLGSILAFLFPSAGPCFYSLFAGPAPEFDSLMQRLNEIQALNGEPLVALRNQSYLIDAHAGDRLMIGGGISAMPSVHNGLAILFALAAWNVSRPLGYVFAAYAFLIWIGSIHLGWHYGLDGVAAVPLTFGIWRLCGRIADRLERPLVGPAAEQALA